MKVYHVKTLEQIAVMLDAMAVQFDKQRAAVSRNQKDEWFQRGKAFGFRECAKILRSTEFHKQVEEERRRPADDHAYEPDANDVCELCGEVHI